MFISCIVPEVLLECRLQAMKGVSMPAKIDLTGRVFGGWTVISYSGLNHLRQPIWRCRCDCDHQTEKDVVGQSLRNGKSVSCGCRKGPAIAKARTKHGHARSVATGKKESRTYTIWGAMHNRCRGGTEAGRKYYVPFGITVCERWADFSNFLADMGEAPAGKSIDRFPNQGGIYEPTNCRWATPLEQIENRRGRMDDRVPSLDVDLGPMQPKEQK